VTVRILSNHTRLVIGYPKGRGRQGTLRVFSCASEAEETRKARDLAKKGLEVRHGTVADLLGP